MTSRVYSVENGGLPSSLSDLTRGDLIVMLKAALITGHNDKIAMGWRLVYDSITNQSDTVRRIVLQSQSPMSEQRYYEVVDDSDQGLRLKMHEFWDAQTLSGAGRSVSLYVHGNNSNRYHVIANEYFCIFQWGSKSYFMGDITPLELSSNTEQSIIMGQTDLSNTSFAIPANNSVKLVGSRKLLNIDNQSLVLRNEHAGDHYGWSNAIHWDNGSVFYGLDSNAPFIKPIDVLQLEGKQARYCGTVPLMFFCSKNPWELVMAQNGQKIYTRHFTHSEELVFLVDEI